MSSKLRPQISRAGYKAVIYGLGALCLIVMVAPVVVALSMSLTSGRTLKFPPPGVSVEWYAKLFDPIQSDQIQIAAWNSFTIAALTVLVAAIFTVPAAYGMARVRPRLANSLEPILLAPLVLPSLVFGIALLITASLLHIPPSIPLVVTGHVVVFGPLMFRTTAGIAAQLDPSLEEASLLMGASRLSTFRRVIVPLLMPGVLAGMFLVFVQSIDNVSMTLFLAPPGTTVLPLRMYAMLEQQLDPRIAAISGVLIALSLLALIGVQRLAPLLGDKK